MIIDYYDCLGMLGVVISVYAYGRVQWQRDFAKTLTYSVCNFVGSGLVIISLLNKWNIAAFIGNTAWVLISLYGIYRCLNYQRRQNPTK